MGIDEWYSEKLENLCLKITDGSHFSPKSTETGYPMGSVKDMTDHGFDMTSCRYISNEDYQLLLKNDCRPYLNDVLIAKDGNTLLKYVFVIKHEREMVILSSIAILRPNQKKVNPDYLKYYLSDQTTKNLLLRGYSSGSAIPRVVLKDFKMLPMKVPSIREQEQIAIVFNSLDDKIILNKAINKNLEEIAQAIFKRWFVDFEFPNENGEPYRSSGGEFQESELGLIPRGWLVSNIGAVGVNRKKSVRPQDMKRGTPYVGLEHISRKSLSLNNYGVSDDLESNKTEFLKMDILFGKLRPYFHKVCIAPIDGVCSTDIIAMYPINIEHYGILVCHIFSDKFIEKMTQSSNGTRMPRTNWNDVAGYKIVLPDTQISSVFSKTIDYIVGRIQNNILENQNLSLIRDSLLPKLMSGEIRVPMEQKYRTRYTSDALLAAESSGEYHYNKL